MPYVLTKPTVPNLNVAGWWDQEDFYGPMNIYEILEKARHRTISTISSSAHGITAAGRAAKAIRSARFPLATTPALYFRQKSKRPGSRTG